ncbi:MAG: hypothetical protein AB7N76_26455 [Planctomycetota bacterium]
MSRTQPPRDAIAATDLWVPIDATGEDFYALGSRFGTQVGVLHALHKESGQPYATHEGAGFLDPWNVRWHRLQRRTLQGVDDNRMAFQVVNDYEGPYEDARPGDAPFGQPELFTSLNRTTREADLQGRVALPSSHRRIIDSEDDRYALALTCRSVPLGTASAPEVPVEDDMTPGSAGVPEGVLFREAGTITGSHGSSTTTQPSVSFGGVTFFGGAAVTAAEEALAAGGSVDDAKRWASAAARGLPWPPLQDAGTRTRDGQDGGSTRTRERPPEPDRNEGGGVPLLDHPAGYVWSLAQKVGLLGTLVCPEGAHGHYFTGREGTPIGPLPLRHDAQVTMGPEIVGRMMFVQDDASQVPEGKGKPIKGELWQDRSRANIDTELGHETTQWRPVLRVDADLPPSKPPPHDPPPWVQPPPKKEEGEDEDDEEGGGSPGGGGRGPTGGGGGPGGSGGEGEGTDSTGIGVIHGGGTVVPRKPDPGGEGDLPPVTAPQSQARDYEGPGVPCPNATAGVFVPSGTRVAISTGLPGPTVYGPGTGPPHRVPGGWIEYFGHPGLTRVPGGLIVGGEEQPLPLGLPGPRRGGVVVDPAPDDGVPRGARVPGDDPGRIGLGLPGPQGGGVVVDPAPDDGVPRGRRVPGDDPRRIGLGLPVGNGPGIGFEPPPGGDRGVPRGWAERQERAEREARARRAREEAERREQQEIERLRRLEQEAREQGRSNRGDRIKRARERMERRRQERQERRQRREDYKERKRQEREERRRRREERKKKREEERAAARARRNRRRDDERERRRRGLGPPSVPQGGYMIDVTDAGSEVLTTGWLPEPERRRRDEDKAREAGAPDSPFGHWNVLNRPIPFLGAVGGPRSLEGWAHLTTFAVRALQRVTCGAFGGPGYLAGNIGVVHRNTVDNPPVGSRIGAHWTNVPDESVLQVCEGESVLDVVSVLEAAPGKQLCACSGSVLRVARDHRGDGDIDDRRPLVVLDDARGRTEADLIADDRGQFRVGHDRGVTATRLRVLVPCGQRGPMLEVSRVCEGRVEPPLVSIEEGRVAMHAGAVVGTRLALAPGAVLEFEGAPGARVSLTEAGLVLVVGAGELQRRMVLGPKGLTVEGDVRVTGKVMQG